MTVEKMPVQKKCTVTHEFRLSYPSLFKPKAFEDQEEKYSCVGLFPKTTNIGKPSFPTWPDGAKMYSLRGVVKNAKIEKWGDDESKWPKRCRSPFRDGDEKEGAEESGYAGMIYCTLSNKKPPGLVDQRRRKIEDEAALYAGCWVRAEVIAFAYDQKGNKGVSLSLQNIQKVRDDEPFGGKRDAADVFSDIESSEDEYSDEDEEDEEDEDERSDTRKASSKKAKPAKRGDGGF